MNIREDISVDPPPNTLQKESMSDLLSGLKRASESGSTSLQSRDIPMDTHHIAEDLTARPNFVPSPSVEKSNYIQDEETMDTLIRQKRQQRKNQMDNFYDEIQTPFLLWLCFSYFNYQYLINQ